LMEKIFDEDVNAVKLLLESHASVSATSPFGETPLHLCLLHCKNSRKMARMLIEAGADPSAKSHNGLTVLMLAACNNEVDPKALKLLLKNETNVNAQDKDGKTALYWAVTEGSTRTVRTLIRHGVDVEIMTKSG
ncbi:ankyrin repeat-containing domain protein, partial [Baffinella frigidus]